MQNNEIKKIEGMEGFYNISKIKEYCKIVELENSYMIIKNNNFEIKKI